MYAIIETGGKQYKAEVGRYIDVELLPYNKGDSVEFSKVLTIVDQESIVGEPFIENKKVMGKVLKHTKGRKVIIYKMHPKKHYHRRKGHRQQYTRVLIENII